MPDPARRSGPGGSPAAERDWQQTGEWSLGLAWATNTINTVIYRGAATCVSGDTQFTAFYRSPTCLALARRSLSTGAEPEIVEWTGRFDIQDAHNSISLQVDGAGFLHLAFGAHASGLRYRRSRAPGDIAHWGDEQALTGRFESHATYPVFLPDPQRPGDLLMMVRDGHPERGDWRLKRFDAAAQIWQDQPEAILSGRATDADAETRGPYCNRPVVDQHGVLHLAYVWRGDSGRSGRRLDNRGIHYCRSRDGGRRWESVEGTPLRLPITPGSHPPAWPVGAGSNLINQSGMAVDATGRPHIVFYADDAQGVPQYQHLWHDEVRWQHQCLSQRQIPFELSGGGTLQLPISRPEVVGDADGRLHVIWRGDLSDDRLEVLTLRPPAFELAAGRLQRLTAESVGFAEPSIDHSRWSRDGVLSMLVQFNHQSPDDRDAEARQTPIRLADWRFLPPGSGGRG